MIDFLHIWTFFWFQNFFKDRVIYKCFFFKQNWFMNNPRARGLFVGWLWNTSSTVSAPHDSPFDKIIFWRDSQTTVESKFQPSQKPIHTKTRSNPFTLNNQFGNRKWYEQEVWDCVHVSSWNVTFELTTQKRPCFR